MQLEVRSCLAGARGARGAVVIIDCFRAGNTVAALLAAGAPFVVPLTGLDQARVLKAAHPDWLLVGERGGLKPEGFDLNNSPAAVRALNLEGRPAILTTSAGTRALEAAAATAQVLLLATLINARAVCRYLEGLGPELVRLVPVGLEAREPAVEDEAAAAYLAALLKGGTPDYRATARAMLGGPGAERLRRLGQGRDLAFCLRLDYLSLVPVAEVQEGRLVLVAAGPIASRGRV